MSTNSTNSSNNSTSGTPTGLMLPKVNGMVGSTPQNSAYQSLNNIRRYPSLAATSITKLFFVSDNFFTILSTYFSA